MILILVLLVALVGRPASAAEVLVPPVTSAVLPPGAVEVFGTIGIVAGANLTVKTATGQLAVDATKALALHYSIPLVNGEPVRIIGTLHSGVLQAESITHAKPDLVR
jgi:hypothetical protein